jgi:hypothetical protein
MVQVSDRSLDGSIESLRVHDILRDFAIQKAEENNFLVVCSKEDDWEKQHCREARRVAVHYSNFNESVKQYASPNLRSLLIFGEGESQLDCSKFRLLRVAAGLNVKLQSFPSLRYLQLSAERLEKTVFNNCIKTMKSLETLDLRSARHSDLTQWLWDIKTLRHVQLGQHFVDKNKTEGPQSTDKLPNLQTLETVKFRQSWNTTNLPNIPEMRELDLELTSDDQSGVIAYLLGKLNHLVYLRIGGSKIQIQKFEEVFPTCKNLKHIDIWNARLNESTAELKDNMLPPNLIVLHLRSFEFKSDPMPVLEKLGSLKILEISYSKTSCAQFSCSAGGFKQLEKLTLWRIEKLQELKIELGALPLLQSLDVAYCKELALPQQQWFIDHKSLRDLLWHACRPDAEKALAEISNARPGFKYSF